MVSHIVIVLMHMARIKAIPVLLVICSLVWTFVNCVQLGMLMGESLVDDFRPPKRHASASRLGKITAKEESAAGCDNRRLADPYSRLLILAPHPDDEILGFAGLAEAFLRRGKKVETSELHFLSSVCR